MSSSDSSSSSNDQKQESISVKRKRYNKCLDADYEEHEVSTQTRKKWALSALAD